jgi:hypothetical protein
MNVLLNAIQIAKSHWKLLLIIFGLGGTGAVAGVLGLDPVKAFTADKIEQVAAPIVSPTVVN